jgi:hypothetical protein
MGVEPAVLLFITVALIQLVGTPNIHDRQGVPLGIRRCSDTGPMSGEANVWR